MIGAPYRSPRGRMRGVHTELVGGYRTSLDNEPNLLSWLILTSLPKKIYMRIYNVRIRVYCTSSCRALGCTNASYTYSAPFIGCLIDVNA